MTATAVAPALDRSLSSLRVALIHDWLTGMRGGEQVLEGILDVVPQAEIFTLFHFPGSVSARIEARPIHTSSLQRFARSAGDYRRLLPFFPRGVREWDLRGFDVVISSSHAVAKGVNAAGRPHLCYCHTPMRYIWDRFDDYFPYSKPLQRAAMSLLAPRLRRWDVRTSAGVTAFLANSRFVADRIARFYGREATVVPPFVDDEFLSAPLPAARGDAHVIVSALVPYKRVELAIDAFAGGSGRLEIIGDGPLLETLRRRATPNVELCGHVSRAELIARLGRARSLILPGVEDFGIAPVEAMALGTPVVAYGEGGVLDSVIEAESGIFFREPVVESLREAVAAVESRSWDRAALRARAAGFSRPRFHQRFREALAGVTQRT